MDDKRFDSIAATIGAATSRRSAFVALVGGALAAAGGALAPRSTRAQGEGDSCRDDDDCGRGLFCKRSRRRRGRNDRDGRRNRRDRSECRYIVGCGERHDFCFDTDDCCGNLRCNRSRERCE
jgi:hypothetical protein